MRITESEIKKEDIMWFAIDKNDIIAKFSSGLYGNIPDEVCQSREDLDLLCDYFVVDAENSTKSETTDYGNKEGYKIEFFKDHLSISQKGIYCFDTYNTETGEYTKDYYKYTKPEKHLLLSELPQNIRIVLEKCRLIDADFCKENIIQVKEAYHECRKKRKKLEIISFVCSLIIAILVGKDIFFPVNSIQPVREYNSEIIRTLIIFLVAIIGFVFGTIAIKKGSRRIITKVGILINGIIVVPSLYFIAVNICNLFINCFVDFF